MSDDNRIERLRLMLIFITVVGAVLIIYLQADSWIQRSQLRDTQRRIATLEQQCK